MISVVCFKWSTPGYRSQFTAAHVNTLAAMVARHYPAPHRMICVTSDAAGIDDSIEIVADRADFADLRNPSNPAFPSCYRRLLLFAPDAGKTFGERIVNLDLDTVIVGDLRPLWDRPEDYIGWQDPLYAHQMCGSMFLLTAGTRPQVWERFDPAISPMHAAAANFRGSDQAWMSYVLGRHEARWTAADGVLSWRKDLHEGCGPLPPGARLVSFHGRVSPWDAAAQRAAWVREHWSLGEAHA